MDQATSRLKLHQLTKNQIAQLDALMSPAWSEPWRDLGYSIYCTLLSLPEALPINEAADLTEALVFGIGRDLGGTQHYIPVVPSGNSSERHHQAVASFRRCRLYQRAVEASRLVPHDPSSVQTGALDALVSLPRSEVWRHLACSAYCTILSSPQPLSLSDAAELAKAIAMGISEDLGGTQPYIAVGSSLVSRQRASKALGLLEQGYSYERAAEECGITSRRIRTIERDSRKGPCRKAS